MYVPAGVAHQSDRTLVVPQHVDGEPPYADPAGTRAQRGRELLPDAAALPPVDDRHCHVRSAGVVAVADETGDPDRSAVGPLGHQAHPIDAVDVGEVAQVVARQTELRRQEPLFARSDAESVEHGQHGAGLSVLERTDPDRDTHLTGRSGWRAALGAVPNGGVPPGRCVRRDWSPHAARRWRERTSRLQATW